MQLENKSYQINRIIYSNFLLIYITRLFNTFMSSGQWKNRVGNHFLKTYSYCKSQYLLKRNFPPSTNRSARSLSLYYFKYLMSLGICTGMRISGQVSIAGYNHWNIQWRSKMIGQYLVISNKKHVSNRL